MNSMNLYEAIGELDAVYVEEALGFRRRRRARIWPAAAACAACAAALVFAVSLSQRSEPAESGAPLPVLTIDEGSFSGMGFEGYMAYDIAELVSSNPWDEAMELEALPVYKNLLVYDEYGRPVAGDEAKMRERLTDVAARFGIAEGELEELEISDLGDLLTAKAEGVSFSVYKQLDVKVDFDTPIDLPERYDFTRQTYADCAAAAAYLIGEYGELLGMEAPIADISGGDYNIYGEQSYRIGAYEGGKSDEEDILGYGLERAGFSFNENGELDGMVFYSYDRSEKIGDYPIISADEAAELLCSGSYITNAPCEFPGRDSVAKVELIYRTSEWDKYLMPYYRFYVELPETENAAAGALGLKTYAAYYVPAVAGEYISGMPVWDGSFN